MILPKAIKSYVKRGDMVVVYSFNNGQYLAFIIISSPQVSYNSLLSALKSGKINLHGIDYHIPVGQVEQWDKQITFTNIGTFGKLKRDTISPNAFLQSTNFLRTVINIPVKQSLDNKVL
ncbi:MAG: hypothetical protein GF350_04775, partial [Chitinivibrionales bacterium]|nr:hypothetical protein [Chitinivibrionales bacterium]